MSRLQGKSVKNVIEISRHRNGVGGAPFYVVLFEPVDFPGRTFVSVVFDGEMETAVLDVDQTAKRNIGFTDGNSWRGDHFDAELRQHIASYEENRG